MKKRAGKTILTVMSLMLAVLISFSCTAWQAEADSGDCAIVVSASASSAEMYADRFFYLAYDLNGGTDGPEGQWAFDDVISDTVPSRSGYRFLGWATAADATEAEYQPGDGIDIESDLTLFALWEETGDHSDSSDTPVNPPAQNTNGCEWCGKDHSINIWQRIIGFFHRIFVLIFGAKY